MFAITQTIKYVDDNGKEAKPEYVRVWDDLEKISAIEDFEQAYVRGLQQMSNLSVHKLRGKGQAVPVTNPVEMQVELLIEEDGVKWCRSLTEYPKMGEEQQALFLGTMDGELSRMPGTARGKEKSKGGKK